MPIHFARFWTADYRHQYCVRCIGEAPEAAINANRYVHYVAFVEIDRALLVALQPEYLPAPLHWDEHLLGRVSMQRRAFARLGAYVCHRETHRALLDVRLQGRILGDAHTHHVDNLALIARNALVKECHVQRLGLFFTCDALALHRLFRDARNRFPSNTWIDNRHGLLPVIGRAARPSLTQILCLRNRRCTGCGLRRPCYLLWCMSPLLAQSGHANHPPRWSKA